VYYFGLPILVTTLSYSTESCLEVNKNIEPKEGSLPEKLNLLLDTCSKENFNPLFILISPTREEIRAKLNLHKNMGGYYLWFYVNGDKFTHYVGSSIDLNTRLGRSYFNPSDKYKKSGNSIIIRHILKYGHSSFI